MNFEKQKICVISFDHWNYDKYIVSSLQSKGIESTHIKIGEFKHANFWEQLKNTFSKILLNKNPKLIKRQEYILETLSKIGKQDQILVINPELIELKYHLEIKKRTDKYIAYLYDSVDRCPVEHLLNGIFDSIFSFDENDIKKFHFQKTTNYIYSDKKEISIEKPKFDAFYLASFDNRLKQLYQIASKLDEMKISYQFIVVGKKTWKKKIISFLGFNKNKSIIYKRKRINQKVMNELYSNSNIIFDLVRENQIGLSFRIFEAMALQKKVITNNKSILNYDFYNSSNILVIDNENLDMNISFFDLPYEPIPEEIYNEYTIDRWVERIFELKSCQ